MKIIDCSRREYIITIAQDGVFTTIPATLQDIQKASNNDYEYAHAITEDIDLLLDIKKDCSIYFQPNRDDKQSKGIILRIK